MAKTSPASELTKLPSDFPRRADPSRGRLFGRRVPLVEKMAFTRHLGLMIKAGFSLPQALAVLVEQARQPYFKEVIRSLEAAIRQGKSFSAALAQFPPVFPELYMNMIRVGEASGNLEEVLRLLAEQLRKEHELKSRVLGALIYPAVIFAAMVGVGIFMMVFIIPKLNETLQALGVPLPFTTQLILGASTWLAQHVFLFFILLAALGLGVLKGLQSQAGRRLVGWLLLRLPVLKKLTHEINTARIARTFGSLLASGVPLVEALEITGRAVSNPYYSEALAQIASRVPKGEKLQKNFERYPRLFPPLIVQMVGVGEEAGALTDILSNLAEFYEAEVDNATKNLGSVIEPLLLIIIGAAVGFFVVSMLMPMFSVYQAF